MPGGCPDTIIIIVSHTHQHHKSPSTKLRLSPPTICASAPSTGLTHPSGHRHTSGSSTATATSSHPSTNPNPSANDPSANDPSANEPPLDRRPTKTSNSAAKSRTDLAIGPTASKWCDTGMIPSCETSPTVGLRAYRAARAAGQTSEASVSVPMASGA